MSHFAKVLKKLRLENGLTQSTLARDLSVTQNAVFNWENEKREPNIDMIKKIADYFDITLAYLLDGEVTPLTENDKEPEKRRKFHSQDRIEVNNWNKELELLNHFRKLNSSGEDEAIKRVSELTELSRYIRQDKPFTQSPLPSTDIVIAAHNDYTREPDELEKMQKDIEMLQKISNLKRPKHQNKPPE